MTASTSPNQNTIIKHAVLVGITPLIPIPFLDDIARAYFQRRLIRSLAAARNLQLTSEGTHTLADRKGGGCLGCLSAIFLYPFKFLFRKIFFFLEFKRAIDSVSHTFYHGYLVDYAFEKKWCSPQGSTSPAALRAAIDQLLTEVNTSVVEKAVRAALKQSMSVLRDSASHLQNTLKGLTRRSSEDEVAEKMKSAELQEEKEIAGIVEQIQTAVNNLPEEHFQQLRERFAAILGIPAL
jgi:Skp family chaperone for outer membrane proteins